MFRSYKVQQATIGLWLACSNVAAQAAHPLITEDTGTQGTGRSQLEFTLERALDHENGVHERAWRYAATYAYGWRDTTDLIVSVPYHRVHIDDGSTSSRSSGVGDVGLDLKWRFYEAGAWSMALKPGLLFPTGDETRELGAGRLGYGAYLVTSFDVAPWAVHLHYGHVRNRNSIGERDGIRHLSVATTREIGRWRWVADIGKQTATDPSVARDPAFVLVGVIIAVTDNIDFDAGYKQSLTSSETDGTWLAGIALRY